MKEKIYIRYLWVLLFATGSFASAQVADTTIMDTTAIANEQGMSTADSTMLDTLGSMAVTDTTVSDTTDSLNALESILFAEPTSSDTGLAAPVDSMASDSFAGDTTVADTTKFVEEPVVEDSVVTEEEILTMAPPWEELPPEMLRLEFGYKGYRWGTPNTVQPRLRYMDTTLWNQDRSAVYMKGTLGNDPVELTYHFADSGFWKVEIRYSDLSSDPDSQVKQFSRIEKSITEIYGPPMGTTQEISGPTPSKTNVFNVKFTRIFYHSTWSYLPVQIELLLNSQIPVPSTDLSIFSQDFNRLVLLYYNPDYMIKHKDEPEEEKGPSIFDIY